MHAEGSTYRALGRLVHHGRDHSHVDVELGHIVCAVRLVPQPAQRVVANQEGRGWRLSRRSGRGAAGGRLAQSEVLAYKQGTNNTSTRVLLLWAGYYTHVCFCPTSYPRRDVNE